MVALYPPLTPARSEIRLLTVLSGTAGEPIRCTLGIASLNDAPQYEALSYVWGDASIKKSIHVEDQAFDVTVNLEAALRNLRRAESSRVLWADAICINQGDIEEKNVQVPMMGRIYTEASEVVVWLGESTPNIELAVAMAVKHSATKARDDDREGEGDENENDGDYDQRSYEDSLDKPHKPLSPEATLEITRMLPGFFEIFDRPYWFRMWTFQEWLLAKTEPHIFCGNLVFQASMLRSVKDRLFQDLDKRLQNGEEADGEIGEVLDLLSRPPDTEREHNPQQDIDLSLAEVNRRMIMKQKPKLLDLLLECSQRRCQDPRDHVYALYGMYPDLQKAFMPDYTNLSSK